MSIRYLWRVFTHLHCHSWFSLGEGATSPEALVEAAAARGFTTLACTDTSGVYGAVEFQRAAEEAGIRPILGAHLVLGDEECVALATDERGWAAMCRAITAIHWATTQRRKDAKTQGLSDLLATDRAGLLLLSASVPFLERVVALSGPRDVYAELTPGKARHAVLAAARRLAVPPVVTNAVRFAHPEDWARHRLLRAIALNTTLSDGRLSGRPDPGRSGATDRAPAANVGRAVALPPAPDMGQPTAVRGGSPVRAPAEPGSSGRAPAEPAGSGRAPAEPAAAAPGRLAPPDAWLKPAAELARHFPDVPEALDRAGELAERCRYRIPIGTRIVPPRYAEAGDAQAELHALAYEGAARRYGTVAPITRDRLEHELAIIGMKGFADYFLVVKDIVEHGPTHCGRGSVANSIVSYCLGITHVEPLGAGLLFERFLNPERKDPPDIDLDFPWDERDHILAWVFRRYPMPRAAMVANHNTFKLRGALREVAKVHGRPAGEIREVTRRIPWYSDEVPIDRLLAEHPNYAGLDLPASWLELARMATPLVGTPRHLSLHPGGVVIVPGALTDFVPVEPAAKELDGAPELTVPVIQFEKDGAEDAGLVKIDLLGNRSLAVIRDGIAAVKANTGRALDYTSAEAGEDPATRELFRTGRTMGVFYTESPASRILCQKSRAESYDLLVLNTSIIRPASNRFIKLYLERLHGAPYAPLDPSLRDVLSETFGVMVYQEDVVNVCAAFAGMPLALADGLRKALSKKRPVKALAAYAEEFFGGALGLGRDPETTRRVWEMVLSFAGYSFCKGHSCSYIQVAQQSCYLRAHYPAEFFAAVLANGGGFYAPFAYVAEARRAGLVIRPPDVNASDFRTTGQGREIRIGFQYVKGLSADAVERILEGRKDGKTESRKDEASPTDRLSGAMDRAPEANVGRAIALPPSEGMGQPTAVRGGSPVRAPTKPEGPVRAPAEPGARSIAPSPFTSLDDLRARTGLRPDDLRLLIKVGALDAIAQGMTRPEMLWETDKTERRKDGKTEGNIPLSVIPSFRPSVLPEYSPERRRATECELLSFSTDSHPMALHQEALRRFRTVPTTELHRHVGRTVLCAGMLTTAKPVHTAKDEPMQFATFDDGHGLIETVLFPDVHRTRGHVLFDQGPFVFRGKVEEEFGAITVTLTHLDRLERMLGTPARPDPAGPP
ncbi:MAG TPA: PHP domain-containing protein [Gemmatimonadales bacterium]|nr:PHP domain-containing protein [Gemmatimonadales bacterium]